MQTPIFDGNKRRRIGDGAVGSAAAQRDVGSLRGGNPCGQWFCGNVVCADDELAQAQGRMWSRFAEEMILMMNRRKCLWQRLNEQLNGLHVNEHLIGLISILCKLNDCDLDLARSLQQPPWAHSVPAVLQWPVGARLLRYRKPLVFRANRLQPSIQTPQ